MPEKEKAPHGGGPIRGGSTPSIVSGNGNGCNIPAKVIERLEREMHGVDFGGVSLIVTIRDGHPAYRIEKTVSIMTGGGA